jgi:hypothetical protein
MRTMAAFIALALVATPAAAADWRTVGSNTSGSKYWLDASTKSRTGATVTIWLKVLYGKPGPNGTTGYRAQREIRCDTKSYRDLSTVYFKDDEVSSVSGVEESRTAPAQSIAAAVVEAACEA